MRFLKIVCFLFLVCFACSESKLKNSKNNRSEVSPISLDVKLHSDDDVDKDVKNYIVEKLTGLGEVSLQELKDSQHLESLYRLIVIPSYDNPFIIRLHSDTSFVYKEYSHEHLRFDILFRRYVDSKLIRSIDDSVEIVHFWTADNLKNDCSVTGGVLYVFEVLKRNKYNIIMRRSPEVCEFEYRKEYLKIFNELIGEVELASLEHLQ